jgi:lysozyme family protein
MTPREIIDGLWNGVKQKEGSAYVNHPADWGGPTRWGVTLAALQKWRVGKTVTAADVAALSESEARAIFEYEYFAKPGFDEVADPHLQAQLVDFGYVSSPARAIRWLQRTIGTPATGVLDDQMLAALHQLPAQLVNNALVGARLYMGYRVIANDPSQKVFEEGWEHRALSFFLQGDA